MNLLEINPGILTLVIFFIILVIIGIFTLIYYLRNSNKQITPNTASTVVNSTQN
jgi:hypothetical protein